ncbi:DUF317 domain-containing protein [Streptomyces sp. NPDC018026]|uniref:DUF317 domain-containing protein n=1 Tax=Streptomyces sp. NPDC018026 TaxID=3365031 RepID=UPI0037B1937A
MAASIDAHVRLDTHPTHPSAVQAVLTGSQAHVASMALEAAGWSAATTGVLVLARIDHEEPYWADDAAQHLTAEDITVEITPRLQEAIDEEWTWPNYRMPWCTRSDIRADSNEAQKIHDDIRNGHLLIHAHAPAHAHDGRTTVAAGTYLHPGGKSVHLHGEDHLRQIADTFDSPAEALVAFEKVHAAEIRPGPAPLTDTERAAIAARSVFDVTTVESEPSHPQLEVVPVYLADAGDHDALLDEHGEFGKWRTWSDETTHSIHESQTLRIERVHETQARKTAWTVAAYETPVSDRLWHFTATGATPAPVLQNLLNHLADGDGWDTVIGVPVGERTAITATQPLTEAGRKHTLTGHGIRWTSPDEQAGVRFAPLTAQAPQNPATWPIWAGPHPDRPTWAITASPHTPSSLLADLSELSSTRPARASPSRAASTGPASQPVCRRLRRSGPTDRQPFTLITGPHERGNIARSLVAQAGDPAHHR